MKRDMQKKKGLDHVKSIEIEIEMQIVIAREIKNIHVLIKELKMDIKVEVVVERVKDDN